MPRNFMLRVGAGGLGCLLCVTIGMAWRAERRQGAALTQQLAAANRSLAAAAASQKARDARLQETLARLE